MTTTRPERSREAESAPEQQNRRAAEATAADETPDDAVENLVDLEALVRRARAIATVAAADAETAERLARAENLWGQATTKGGRRYYFDKVNFGVVQWETPKELKGSKIRVMRADETRGATLPEPWRELKSGVKAEDGVEVPYYWNVETGETRWERPKNSELVVGVVIPARATPTASK